MISFPILRGFFRVLMFTAEWLGTSRTEFEKNYEVSDEVLTNRMRDGDASAFEQLYERYFQKIYTFVIRRVSRREVAEDLVSEIFLKAFAHRASFIWKTSFSAWVYRIAANTVTDHYRTRKPTEELHEEFGEGSSHDAGLEKHVDHQLLGQGLERVLEQLNVRERLAVSMKFYAECSHQEIAEALECTPNNAGVILYRALKKCESLADDSLKAMMETFFTEENEKSV
ncbi:MAG: RNA polymerase sigma factor, sigma-70 family [Candidatus Uhrbacteria bacterium GW2011_GWF2_41_16]|uniref:RNA polymerase sigma factor, sigma-70 family n=2 Tax=Candidatus Uhriibacteriota TaxID=1752732 RepID=A0A0G0YC16_9BACT|nr:MAG: RNA polymerase sigma factor, sigma-70 family [Candidatus Uhrbacteria bacterium GW2011_GWA2_41_10]KKR87128.1 MAG: RNA polymerase sigma factor, sigma-70 family [Candidatus Uhrbacteria bacterium GW2011_GWC2_41_11]KKR97877.1 MAG: RNA polymerase sigma factor, sigma-70 family [Candidatus Uhrbacteria bacterium GW2011_GWF2_41_16]HBP00554.1 hypothetical protein [Candidatus Uhrbacteria bacterium]